MTLAGTLEPIMRGRLGVVLAIVLGLLAWNVYVAINSDGQLRGIVRNADGQSVAGAEVTLFRRDVLSEVEVGNERTDVSGRFAFEDHGGYDLILVANGPNDGHARRRVNLLFRNQNHILEKPLVLE